MTLRVIGAGLGRTGTTSLKLALERLLGAPCYHMLEVFGHPEHVPPWHAAARGEPTDWDALFRGYRAAVDWPAAAFWKPLAERYPEALVVLSLRDPARWWESANATIFPAIRGEMEREGVRPQVVPPLPEDAPAFLGDWHAMVTDLLAATFGADPGDREACIAAFEAHVAAVRRDCAPERLLEWRVEEGWEPLCSALGVPVPGEPFPRANTREDWRAHAAAAGAPS